MWHFLSRSIHLFFFYIGNYHHGNCREAIKVHVAMETVNKEMESTPTHPPTCVAMLHQIHYDHISKLNARLLVGREKSRFRPIVCR